MRLFITRLLLMTVYSYGFDYNLRAYTITEGVSCFFGINEEVNSKNGGRTTNTCYIETKIGYVVIDSGPTNSYAQQAYNFMQKKRKLPIKYVINTSAHETKILGNKFYKERGATLVGPEAYRKLLVEKKYFEDNVLPKDPWGNEFIYILDSNNKFDIISFGANAKEGEGDAPHRRRQRS